MKSRSIAIELGGTYLAPYWSTAEQLRVSTSLLARVVQRLEDAAGAIIGARDFYDPAAIHDLEQLRQHELEALSDREIQHAAITIDGAVTEYRLTTDGVGGGMLALHIPSDKRASMLEVLQEETKRLRAAGHRIRIPGLDREE